MPSLSALILCVILSESDPSFRDSRSSFDSEPPPPDDDFYLLWMIMIGLTYILPFVAFLKLSETLYLVFLRETRNLLILYFLLSLSFQCGHPLMGTLCFLVGLCLHLLFIAGKAEFISPERLFKDLIPGVEVDTKLIQVVSDYFVKGWLLLITVTSINDYTVLPTLLLIILIVTRIILENKEDSIDRAIKLLKSLFSDKEEIDALFLVKLGETICKFILFFALASSYNYMGVFLFFGFFYLAHGGILIILFTNFV